MILKLLCAQLWVTEAWAYQLAKAVIKAFDKTYVNREDFEDWIDWKLQQAPDEIMDHHPLQYTLHDRLVMYKEWSEEPLDWDEVEWFIEMIRADVNKHEGNM